MPYGPYSQLPVDVYVTSNSMPTSPTAATTTTTDLYEATFQQATASSIVVTLVATSDASFIPIVFTVDPNVPYCLTYPEGGLNFSGGVTWSAASAGVIGTLRGMRRGGLTLSGGVATGTL